jgi:hypothetical protein
VEARPVYGRGRPSLQKPRPGKVMRERLKTTIRTHTERIVRLEEEAGCFVLLTNVPPGGDLAHSARDILSGDNDHHGPEQPYGLLKDPVMVKRLVLKKPERIEALGLVCCLALRMGRVMERALRRHVDTPRTALTGWDKQATERPTSFMMVTKCAGVIVVTRGAHRQLARPLSMVPPQALTALDVPAASCTGSKRGERDRDDGGTPLPTAETEPALAGCRLPADARQDHEQPPGVRPRPPGGHEHEQP